MVRWVNATCGGDGGEIAWGSLNLGGVKWQKEVPHIDLCQDRRRWQGWVHLDLDHFEANGWRSIGFVSGSFIGEESRFLFVFGSKFLYTS